MKWSASTVAAFVTSFATDPIHHPRDFLVKVVLNDDSHLFETWLMLGAVLAAPVFASTVVAAFATLAAIIWWVARRGRDEPQTPPAH